jgi:hypothetical protein
MTGFAFSRETKEKTMKYIPTKFTLSFATLKPYLLMLVFVICVLNVAIVRADDNSACAYLGAGIDNTIAA